MFQKFTSSDALQGIGQNLLSRFLEPFTGDLAAQRISLPGPNLPEKLYFPAVAAIFANHDSLPASLIEALSALEEMSHPECRQRIETALAHAPCFPTLSLALTAQEPPDRSIKNGGTSSPPQPQSTLARRSGPAPAAR